jgi:hypothetical protein
MSIFYTRSSDRAVWSKTLLICGGVPCVPRGESAAGGERVEWGGQGTGRVANDCALPQYHDSGQTPCAVVMQRSPVFRQTIIHFGHDR